MLIEDVIYKLKGLQCLSLGMSAEGASDDAEAWFLFNDRLSEIILELEKENKVN